MANVLQKIVKNGWCVGCGMCAGICPKNRLEICFNQRGEYNPVERKVCEDCGDNCNLCYQVCPASGQVKKENQIEKGLFNSIAGMSFREETGYYLSSWLGYSKVNGHRENGASGGMATWTLESLLESGEVDYVICVGQTHNTDKLLEFKICSKVEEVRNCGRSAYYPVEISNIIQHVLQNDGRYAIIGLPCVCKAIRLGQEIFPKLKNRIHYILGLTCGHSCSKYFAEYLCALGGGNPHDMRTAIFRIKDPNEPVSNMGMYFVSGEGETEQSGCPRWKDGFGFAFMNGYFENQGCFFCDDIFAEFADVTFMDAWLPEYENQPEGHSIVLVRNNNIQKLLCQAGTDLLHLTALPIEDVIKSQIGAIRLKRKNLWVHLRESHKVNNRPIRRQSLLKPTINPFRYNAIALHKTIADKSPVFWLKTNGDIAAFTRVMAALSKKLKLYTRIGNAHKILLSALRKCANFFISTK